MRHQRSEAWNEIAPAAQDLPEEKDLPEEPTVVTHISQFRQRIFRHNIQPPTYAQHLEALSR